MDILNLSALIANPEITEAVAEARRLLPSVLPEADFAHREQFALMLRKREPDLRDASGPELPRGIRRQQALPLQGGFFQLADARCTLHVVILRR
jgi:hypothetical protein